MKKSGFSLMELLIVMVILAGIITMIIPNMSSGTEAQIKRSMENDMRAAIAEKQIQMLENENY